MNFSGNFNIVTLVYGNLTYMFKKFSPKSKNSKLGCALQISIGICGCLHLSAIMIYEYKNPHFRLKYVFSQFSNVFWSVNSRNREYQYRYVYYVTMVVNLLFYKVQLSTIVAKNLLSNFVP